MTGARRPLPSDNQDWWREAACRGSDPSIFYNPDDERGAFRRRREHLAKAICAGCPVQRECLEWALAKPETHGVWGGLTADERTRRRPSTNLS